MTKQRAYILLLDEDTETLEQLQTVLQREGYNVRVAVDGQFAGLLAVSDRTKPTTPEAVAALHQSGHRLVMLTGDNRRVADRLGQQLGADEVQAELLPEQKA